MDWFFFALLAAVFASLNDYFSKRGVKNVNEYVMAFGSALFALPFLLIYLSLNAIPILGPSFWTAWVISGLLNVLATILFFKALKFSDISLAMPLLMLTPLFLTVAGPLITGEFPTPFGIAGALLIVFGSYLLKVSMIRNGGLLAPFQSLFRDRGAKYMATVALIYSVTSSFDKIGVVNSSPVFWTVSLICLMTVCLFFISFSHLKREFHLIKSHFPIFIGIGILSTLTFLSQNTALSQANVLYVTSVKRLSVFLSVLQGRIFFNEIVLVERLVGTFFMFMGVLVIRFLGT